MSDPFAILTANRPSRPEQPVRPHLWALIVVVLLLIVVALEVLGPGTPPASPTPSTEATHESRVYTVSYRFGVYSPTNLRVHAGDTVRFQNDGSQPVRIVADTEPGQSVPEFDSIGPVQPGGLFSVMFANLGTFSYHTAGKERETGTIIVR